LSSFKADAIWEIGQDEVFLDVRTPAEYERGHIPGALNLPLFSNEERAEVGTLYKQVNPEVAFLKGLEFAGARMRWYVEEALRLAPAKKVRLHCWRGGQRSGSLTWLLRQAGFEVLTLEGGYKAYRQFILEKMASPWHQLIILGGYTGSDKTGILQAIQSAGEYVVDLEALAHHKGSSFGALGEHPQPTIEQFENDLFEALRKIPDGARLWLEDESRSIGKVYLPDGFWQLKCQTPIIKIEVPLRRRVQQLVEGYAAYPKTDLVDAFTRLQKKLGGQHLKAAVEALDADDYARAAEIALVYYDKAYQHSIDRKTRCPLILPHPVEDQSAEEIAAELIDLANSRISC
jgi:tRNA 2-selenouridine synthase